MPNNTSRRKMRHCRDCGRPFAAANATAESCADCQPTSQPTRSHRTKQRTSEPALAAAGARSSGEGEWITPPVMYSDDESSESDETSRHDESSEPDDSGSHNESNTPESPGKTKWRSPPFTIQFAAPDEMDDPAVPPEDQPSRLKKFLKSAFVVATLVILAVGGGLIWRYGVPKAFWLPAQNQADEQPAAVPQPTGGTEQEQREAAFRHQRDAKRQQQRAVAVPKNR